MRTKMLRRIRGLFRTFSRMVFGALPRQFRFKLMRKQIRVNPKAPPELTFRVARSQSELEAAFSILHDAYVGHGFMKPHESGMRVTKYHALPSTSTLIALWDDEVVGTVSIIRDSPLGFPLDKIFDTGEIRKNRARLAEISSLAIHKSYRGDRGMVLFPLMKFMSSYCLNYFGVDCMVIAVNPSWIDFYEAILGFERLQEKKVENYDFVNGAPAVGAYLPLRKAYEFIARRSPDVYDPTNFYSYMTAPDEAALIYPERNYKTISDPVFTPTMLEYFFNYQTDVFNKLEPREKAIFAALYDHHGYQGVLPEVEIAELNEMKRKEQRFEVACVGRVLIQGATRVIKLKVSDVSIAGFCAHLDSNIRFGTPMQINIVIGDFEIVDIVAVPVWENKIDGTYGFSILESSENWVKFVKQMKKDLHHAKSAIEPLSEVS